jgi:iron complex outermembrane recepter protein
MTRDGTSSLALAISLVISSPGLAQAVTDGEVNSDSSLDADSGTESEIIVTARRREEALADVPVAITALNSEDLRNRQLQTESDLQSAVPGLTIRQSGSANLFNFALRGQSVDTYTNSPPGVLPYVNEAQLVSRSAGTFYDLASVQVVKGPQGTLFGRNATGGAVLFETVNPGPEFGGYAQIRYGNYDLLNVESAVSVPLGQLGGIRIAGVHTNGGAFVRNLARGERLGKQDTTSVRGTLDLNLTPALRNITVVQHTSEAGTNVPAVIYSAYACGRTSNGITLNSTADCFYGPGSPAFQAFLAAHPNLFPGGVAAAAAAQRARGPWISDINVPLFHKAKSTFVINTTTLELSPSLTLKNIFAYNHSQADDGFDYDGTPYPIFQTAGTPTADATSVANPRGFIQKTRQITNELQLQGKAFDNRLDFVVGAYYLEQRDENDSNLYGFDFSPVFPGIDFRYRQLTNNTSKALFAQGTYAVTDRLNFTAGGRYTWETTTARQLPGSIFGTGFPEERLESSNPSWTFSLDYKITPDLLGYVAQRGSWRAGGYNYSVLPINVTAAQGGNLFLPELTRDVEVGLKYSGRGLGVPATLNLAFYNQWVRDVQRAAYVIGVGGTPSLVTTNVPSAEITGVEVDFSVQPMTGLSVGGSVAYTNARYTDNLVTLVDANGNVSATRYGPYADAPKWTGNFFVQAEAALSGNAGEITVRVDVFAQSKFFFSNVAATLAPETDIPGYALVNGRVAWSKIGGTGLTAAAFVRNLFNKQYYGGGNPIGPTLGLNVAVPGRPRMFGGELRFEF